MKKLIAVWLMSLVLGTTATAQIGSHMKEEFQDPEKHGIRIVERVSEVRGVIHDASTRILCLQAFGEDMPAETQAEILQWVRAGHTVWFYDTRLAPAFGMLPYMLSEEQFRHKAEKGVLGGSKRHGLATVGVSYGSHAVQTGVGQVTVFLPEVVNGDESKSYGAVEVAGDTVALLQFALDSPALMALRREGRGLIVFKDLLWNEPLSGDRFQLNLLDFSAGFQVPGPAGQGRVGSPPGPEAEYVEGSPASPLEAGSAVDIAPAVVTSNASSSSHPKNGSSAPVSGTWSLELKDGTVLTGDLDAGAVIEFETSTTSLKLKAEEISRLEIGSSVKLDKVVTVKGKSQSGLLLTSPLKFRTERGVEQFDKEDLLLLQRSAEEPAKEK